MPLVVRERLERYPGCPYYLLGGLFLGLSTGHLLAGNQPLVDAGLSGILPVALACGILVAGYLFRRLRPPGPLIVRTGLILGGGAGFSSAVAWYIVWIQSSGALTVLDLGYPVIVAGTAGTLLATPISYYYVTAAQRVATLEAQYTDRADAQAVEHPRPRVAAQPP